ncbi:MAG: IS21 family transposase [Candidatus Auribacterota bacterium]|nr:IS21 family transposase [Candidatus Auribacterota bacterium]
MLKLREILRLALLHGMSERQISKSCSVSRSTAGKYKNLAENAGLTYEDVEKMDDLKLLKLLKSHRKKIRIEKRHHPDWNWIHQELRKKSVTLQLLWEEYKDISPDGYQRTQFYEHYRSWRKKLNVSMRQDHKAGEKMFVDFAGQTVKIADRLTGDTKEAEIFIAVLGASNYTYAEAVGSQDLFNWIEAHGRAFEYFGGITEIVIPDNLKSGVSKTCIYEPELNATYHEMAVHYGTTIIPARVRKPKDKAKAEIGVFVVERWILAALRNRTFFSLEELNQAIRELLEKLNNRKFKKLDGTRLSWFETIEKGVLKPLPQERYEISLWKMPTVNIDYHVEIEKHYYSVPYQLAGKKVAVRYTAKTVEIFINTNNRVASHKRSYVPYKATTIIEHMPKAHQEHLKWTPTRIIKWAATVGESCAAAVDKIIATKDHPAQGYRSCLGILRMGNAYSNDRLEAACKRALAINGCSYSSIKSILKNGLDSQPMPQQNRDGIQINHENLRGGKYYN